MSDPPRFRNLRRERRTKDPDAPMSERNRILILIAVLALVLIAGGIAFVLLP